MNQYCFAQHITQNGDFLSCVDIELNMVQYGKLVFERNLQKNTLKPNKRFNNQAN